MAIHVYCPGCEALLVVADAKAGRTTHCEKCGIEFNVPNPFPIAKPIEEPTRVIEPANPVKSDAGDETLVVEKTVTPTTADDKREPERPRTPNRPPSPPPVKKWDDEARDEAPYRQPRRRGRTSAPPRSALSSTLLILLAAVALALLVLLIGFLGLSTMGQNQGGNFGKKAPPVMFR